MILPLAASSPRLGKDVFVAPDAWVIGDVELADNVSVFFGAVLRGDLLPIRVGRGTNIQEHSMLHTTHGRAPAVVGEYCTIGHRAIIHGCTVGNRCLVGMGAIILDGTVVEDECVIAAGALIPEGKHIPARSMVMGVPGKVVRSLTAEEVKMLPVGAERYIETGATFRGLLG